MKIHYVNTTDLRKKVKELSVGDKVYLSGIVYTSRDAAHKRIFEAIANGEKLPYEIYDSVVYYAGPTPTPDGLQIGSCGPTTSGRMDSYSPSLLDMGQICMIGKGERSKNVVDAIVRNGAVYLCAVGGAGALAAKCIDSCKVIAYDDLGCESVKELHFNNFPLTVAIDSKGNNIFEH
ncbi:MAG: fumarate hydratase C-terminal domain-containing protein [Clostridia bacterium]|nr:fumarate hydratase C-terminal domain-containing protein [Clostridia bacterium]